MTDPYYRTRAWLHLRHARLKLDRHVCVVPGCGQPATVVDHIVSRRAGGPDVLANLRSLCKEHDGMVKERSDGKRAMKGKLVARGCDANGMPNDPGHPWYSKPR